MKTLFNSDDDTWNHEAHMVYLETQKAVGNIIQKAKDEKISPRHLDYVMKRAIDDLILCYSLEMQGK